VAARLGIDCYETYPLAGTWQLLNAGLLALVPIISGKRMGFGQCCSG